MVGLRYILHRLRTQSRVFLRIANLHRIRRSSASDITRSNHDVADRRSRSVFGNFFHGNRQHLTLQPAAIEIGPDRIEVGVTP